MIPQQQFATYTMHPHLLFSWRNTYDFNRTWLPLVNFHAIWSLFKTIWNYPPPVDRRTDQTSVCNHVFHSAHCLSYSLSSCSGPFEAPPHTDSLPFDSGSSLVCESILFAWLYIHAFDLMFFLPCFLFCFVFWVCYLWRCYLTLLTSFCHHLKLFISFLQRCVGFFCLRFLQRFLFNLVTALCFCLCFPFFFRALCCKGGEYCIDVACRCGPNPIFIFFPQ